jgi:AcrR family transcriptional regulator
VTSSTHPKRRRLSADERRALILEAARDIFAARGYHASSLDDIAQAAGVSKALIYEHFPSKKDLHVSLLEANVAELFSRLAADAAPEGGPGDERLRRGVDAFLRFVEERRGAWRMLFRDATDPEVAEALQLVQRQATALIAELIAAEPAAPGTGTEEERRRSIEVIAQLLTGAVQALANWWHDHPEVPREVLVERVMDFAWLGLERVRGGERYAP